MTNNGYLAIGIAVGTVIGAGAGVAITYFSMKKKCEERISEEIEAFKEEYKASPRYPHFDDLDSGTVESKSEHHKTIASSSLDGGPVSIERTAYHKIASNYKKNLDEVIAESESPSDDDPDDEDANEGNDDIFIMSSEEFNTSEYDSANLIYYAEDDALFDGVEEIEDREVLVGSCLESLDIPKGKEGVVFIRNEKLGMDYEIDVLWDKYETNDD